MRDGTDPSLQTLSEEAQFTMLPLIVDLDGALLTSLRKLFSTLQKADIHSRHSLQKTI